MADFKSKLIHVARIQVQNQRTLYLFLRQIEPYCYRWFREEQSGMETDTGNGGTTAKEAFLEAYQAWNTDDIRMLNCGFLYTLPERDEIGTNALFSQMIASYGSSTGVYFDEELSSNCIVQNASAEARNLNKRLQQTVTD